MPGSLENQRHVSVFETTLSIEQNTLSVFNIIITSSTSTVSLIRYPFDLIELHQKIRFHYPKCKISFPTLNNPSKKYASLRYSNHRRSFRDLLLPFSRKKTNADKITRYLNTCFAHPYISTCSLLKDFSSVQRDEDALLTSQHTCTTLTPTLPPKKPAPQKNVDSFDLLQVLGKGCMGKVLLVRQKQDAKLYALKCIKKNWVIKQKELIHTIAEKDILILLRGQPFIANLHDVFQTSSQLFLVLDYYAGGDLATQLSLLTSFDKERTRFYAAEIVYGLKILHEHGVVCRDLKPENVLIGHDGHIVLTDFGLSKLFQKEDVPYTQTFCGTAEYLAPEVLLGQKYTYVVDFWSLGTLLYEMLAGTTPFWADNHMDMYKRVLEDKLVFPSQFDAVTRNLLSGLLQKDAFERLGQDTIEDIMSHPYFDTIDWCLVSHKKLTPPYVPNIKHETDLTHFDPVFTNLPVRISECSDIELDLEQSDPFQSFSFHSTITHMKKRPSSMFMNTEEAGPSTIKKRHTQADTISTRSSMTFSFHGNNTSIEAPYVRPHCPLPGQTRHSNASTLANSFTCHDMITA